MAYDKHTWTCNEPITVERLNHIEDGIAAGGDCDCGFECEDGRVTLIEQSVTTEQTPSGVIIGGLDYEELIDAETIIVTFNGTEYECERITVTEDPDLGRYQYVYGGYNPATPAAPDFSEYPFVISSVASKLVKNSLLTEIAGTYTIKIETVEEIITTTPCFDKARGYSCGEEMGVLTEESVTTEASKEEGDSAAAFGDLSYSQPINQDTITVTFNGTEYQCEVTSVEGVYLYGASYDLDTQAYDWSEYPFAVVSDIEYGNMLATETAGTYSVKIEAAQEVATTTPCFEKAVKSVMGEVVAHMTETYDSSTECTTYTLDITDDDVRQIVESGSKLKIIDEDNYVYYPVNIWKSNATPALRGLGQQTAKITIIFDATPLVLATTTNDSTPRYLYFTACPSSS